MPSEAEITDTELLAILANDPNAVHINLLRRSLARPTVSQIIHIYGEDAIRAALSAASAVRSEPEDELLRRELGLARGYALGLAGALHRKHFPEVTEWKALPDLLGLLTQIDNMSASLVRTSPVQTREDGIREAIKIARFTQEQWRANGDHTEAGAVGGLARVLEALLSQPEPKGDKHG
jgi:hypothetical protein